MSQIRIGSVGIGSISRGVHLPGIDRSPDLRLTAVCDIDPEALRYARETYGIDEAHCFTDYRDLIRCPDVDAVDISTPNCVHYEIALAAAEAGKPYAVEKPITMTAAEADRLAAVTKEKGVQSMVCFSYRFKAAARYARDLVERGMIGDIYHVDMQYYQAWGLPHCNTPLVWRFEKQYTGSGALGDLGSHALDLVRFVTGKEYRRVVSHAGTFVHEREKLDGSGMGKVDVDDFANYFAEMDGGDLPHHAVRLRARQLPDDGDLRQPRRDPVFARPHARRRRDRDLHRRGERRGACVHEAADPGEIQSGSDAVLRRPAERQGGRQGRDDRGRARQPARHGRGAALGGNRRMGNNRLKTKAGAADGGVRGRSCKNGNSRNGLERIPA